MYLHFAKQTAQEVFLHSLLPLWLTEDRQRSAWLSLASCVPVSIYTPVCGLASPTLGCIRPLTHYTHRQIQTGHSFRSSLSALVQNDALDVSAVLTGRSVCVFAGSVRGDGDHLHGGRAPLQQHVQVQSEGLQRQRSGPVQQDPDHADLWEYVKHRLLSPRL